MSPFDKAWSPYAAGILIGLLQIPAFLIIETALGASSSYVTVGAAIAGLVDPSLLKIDYVARHIAANAEESLAGRAGRRHRLGCFGVDEDVGRGPGANLADLGQGARLIIVRLALCGCVCGRLSDAVGRPDRRWLHQRPRPVRDGAIVGRLDGCGRRDVRRRYRYRSRFCCVEFSLGGMIMSSVAVGIISGLLMGIVSALRLKNRGCSSRELSSARCSCATGSCSRCF